METKKIAIITEYNDIPNINYGNALQLYALNYILNKSYDRLWAETICVESNDKKKYIHTARIHEFVWKAYRKINNMLYSKSKEKQSILEFRRNSLNGRIEAINNFVNTNCNISDIIYKFNDFENAKFDAFIVGSDVVWTQSRYSIDRIKFLDLDIKFPVKKFSYAASFGNNTIPKNNKRLLKRYLHEFDMISVREGSSVEMLKELELHNVEHVVDPTLLIERKIWERNAKKPDGIDIPERYLFAYILGQENEQREIVTQIAKILDLKVITIPFANGSNNEYDKAFGNIKIMPCSPENWLWLIENAMFVITDSFHGTVFSNIFEKKYFVLTRRESQNISNRLIDYLSWTDQKEYYIDDFEKALDIVRDDKFIWNYDRTNQLIEYKIDKSFEFLRKCIQMI